MWGYLLIAYVVFAVLCMHSVNTKQYRNALYCIFAMCGIGVVIMSAFVYYKFLGGAM